MEISTQQNQKISHAKWLMFVLLFIHLFFFLKKKNLILLRVAKQLPAGKMKAVTNSIQSEGDNHLKKATWNLALE